MPITTSAVPCWELVDHVGHPVDDGGGPIPHFAAEADALVYLARALDGDADPELNRWTDARAVQGEKPCVQATCGGCGEQLRDDEEATCFEYPAEAREIAGLRDWLNDADDDLRCSTACTNAGLLARATPGLEKSTIRDLDRHIAALTADRDAALARVAELDAELAAARVTAVRDLVGDLHADEPNGILDHYSITAVDRPRGKPYVVWHCAREHESGVTNGHVGIIARDLDLSQDGLTLAELVSAAIEHETEDHAGGTRD